MAPESSASEMYSLRFSSMGLSTSSWSSRLGSGVQVGRSLTEVTFTVNSLVYAKLPSASEAFICMSTGPNQLSFALPVWASTVMFLPSVCILTSMTPALLFFRIARVLRPVTLGSNEIYSVRSMRVRAFVSSGRL